MKIILLPPQLVKHSPQKISKICIKRRFFAARATGFSLRREICPKAGAARTAAQGRKPGASRKKRAAEFVPLPICMRQYPPLSRLHRIQRGFPAAHGAHIPAQRAPQAVRRAEKQRAEHERRRKRERLRQKLLFRAEKAARNRKFTFRTRKILEISAFCVILKLTRTGGFVPQAPTATRLRRGPTPPTATKRHAFPPAACLPVRGAHYIYDRIKRDL